MKNNFKLKLALWFLFFFTISITDCKKEPPVEDLYIIDVQSETDWDYWVVAKDGGSILIQLQNSIPSIVYFKPFPDQDGYPIFLDEQGLPSKAVIQDHIFLFGNIRKSLMDLSVILPNGEIRIFRDIQTDYNLTSGQSKSQINLLEFSEIIKFSGRVVGAVSCAVGVAAAAPTGGLSLTLAYVGCGALFVGWAADLLPESTVTKVTGLSAFTVGSITTAVGCATGSFVTCGLGITSKALTVTGEIAEDIENNNDKVDAALALLKLYEAKRSISVPTIDGQVNSIEWSNSSTYSITFTRLDGYNTVTGTLYLQHDGVWLYAGVKTKNDAGWDVYLAFKYDGNNDNLLNGNSTEPHTDINIEYPSPEGWDGYIRYDYLATGTAHPTTAPVGTNAASYGTNDVNYEYKIKLSDLDISSDQKIGFYIYNLVDADPNHGYEFPVNAAGTNPSKWAHILLR